MKKRIICSSCAAIASMITVLCMSIYAVDAPEETVPEVTTTGATTTSCSTTITSRMTTSTSTSTTTENTTTMLTTTTEVSTEVNEVITESIAETETPVTELVTEPIPVETVPVEEYVVYKPSSYYIHRNTCRWNSGDAYRIDNTEGIEARRCSECNPDMEIINEYVEPLYKTPIYCDPTDREYLAQIVAHEAGSDWISTYNKACVVAVVMNRVNSSQFPNTVYDVLTQPKQFSGFWFGYSPSQSCYDAVDYYFEHQNEFGNILYFHGDGNQNYFS